MSNRNTKLPRPDKIILLAKRHGFTDIQRCDRFMSPASQGAFLMGRRYQEGPFDMLPDYPQDSNSLRSLFDSLCEKERKAVVKRLRAICQHDGCFPEFARPELVCDAILSSLDNVPLV